jgi:hypothetical protein
MEPTTTNRRFSIPIGRFRECSTSFRSRARGESGRGPGWRRYRRVYTFQFNQGWLSRRQAGLSPSADRWPALRRAVPALIIAFLLTICVGAFVQVLDGDVGGCSTSSGADINEHRPPAATRRIRQQTQSELDGLSPPCCASGDSFMPMWRRDRRWGCNMWR